MPFAQSSELPPPSATMESTPAEAATRASGFDHVGVGVGIEVVKRRDLDARIRQRRAGARDVARLDQPRSATSSVR